MNCQPTSASCVYEQMPLIGAAHPVVLSVWLTVMVAQGCSIQLGIGYVGAGQGCGYGIG